MNERYKVEIKPSYEWSKKASKFGITHRELEVLALMTEGHSNKEISEMLGITYQAVKNHNFRLTKKLGVKNNNQALAVALHHNLIKVRYESEYMKAEIEAEGAFDKFKNDPLVRELMKKYGVDPEKL